MKGVFVKNHIVEIKRQFITTEIWNLRGVNALH